MSDTLVIYEKTMAVDCAIVAIIKQLTNSQVTLLPLTKTEEITVLYKYDYVLVVGTYWNHQLNDIKSKCYNLVVFTFGDPLGDPLDSCKCYNIYDNVEDILTSCVKFTKECDLCKYSEDMLTSNFNETFKLECFNDTFTDMKDRVKGPKIFKPNILSDVRAPLFTILYYRIRNQHFDRTNVFFTGLYNYFGADEDFVSNFEDLITGEADYDDVIKVGQSIIDSQIKMVRNRIKNNSLKYTNSRNEVIVVTLNPELITIAHNEVRNMFNCDISISITFDLPNSKLKYSVRTFNGTSALELINKLTNGNGGGSETGAGGSIDHNLPIGPDTLTKLLNAANIVSDAQFKLKLI